jgi:SAM-dependent methyltransferase
VKSDRVKWDRRYGAATADLEGPDPLLMKAVELVRPGRALDLACGRGANALFLAENGFQVDAVDISIEALRTLQSAARRRHADVASVVADLDYFTLPESVYDLVAVFYFFAEPLIGPIKAALKPGGMLCYATYNVRHQSVKPGFNPAYLIEPNALTSYFSGLEPIFQDPDAGEWRNVSYLLAQRPY